MPRKAKPNQKALATSGRISTAVLKRLTTEAKPGATGLALNEMAEQMIRDAGGVPAFLDHQGFPASICVSANDRIVHGLPNDTPFKAGDLVKFDVGVKVDGWYTDTAVTVGVGRMSPRAERLAAVTRQALAIALGEARDGRTTGDLGAAVQAFVEEAGFNVIRDCVGHGIGKKLHTDPSIPNFGTPGEGATFREGMVVAIEPMVSQGSFKLKLAKDKWTLAMADGGLGAHFEETVMITKAKPVRFTPVIGALSAKKPDGKLQGAAHG